MKKILLILFMLFFLTSCGEKQYTGTIEYSAKPHDDYFNIEVESPVLIREVKMVQYYLDDGGVRTVLANYPIESFEYNGKTYTNPEFPSDITNKIIYSTLTLQDIEMSDDLIYSIINSDKVNKIQLTNLDANIALEHGMILENNSFITASDEWNVGELKVTYYYINPSTSYVINAKLKDNKLVSTDKFDISVSN